jgi:hypothetical protein
MGFRRLPRSSRSSSWRRSPTRSYLVLVALLMAALGYGLQTLVLNRLLGRGILPPS